MGKYSFSIKKVKILTKQEFFSAKNHDIDTSFPLNDVYAKSTNIGIDRGKDALSFGIR